MTGAALAVHQFRFDQKTFWRNPAAVFFTVAFPVMFLVIFDLVFGNGNRIHIQGVGVGVSTYYVPAIITLAVIPSFWLYFADQVLQWKSFWLVKLKEAIAAGEITFAFATFFLVAYLMQKQRQKLRGTAGGTRPSGGYK